MHALYVWSSGGTQRVREFVEEFGEGNPPTIMEGVLIENGAPQES